MGLKNFTVIPVTEEQRVAIVGAYRHPAHMTAAGVLAWLASVAIAGFGITDLLKRL